MKIKNKLYISAGISIILVVALVSVVLVMSGRIAEENEKHQLLMDVYESVSELDIVTYDYLLHREKRMEYQWNIKHDSLGEILDGLAEEERLLPIRADYAALGNLFSQVTGNYRERQEYIQEGASQEKIDAIIGLEERLVAQLLITSHLIITDASRLAEEAHTEATEAQRLASNLTVILVVVLAIAITTSSLLIARGISKPLGALTKGAEIIGKGDLEHKVRVKSKDELGQLAATFNKMTKSLKKVTASRDELDREVAERKQAEEDVKKYAEQLEQANIRLQELDHLKSVFLASMSHELRTPLNSIIGYTGLILQDMVGEINQEQREQLTVVKRNANHLLSLINDILDISRIEAGKVELSLEEFSLDDVVREVVETLSPAASEKGLELLTEVPEDITLLSDTRRVKQVLVNLVSNAVKFTDQGSVRITARVLEDDNLEIRVIDTGIGIKKEDMYKLFQPFQQVGVSLAMRHKGTGLGLYLTKKLVTILGGDISANSEYGRGSEFTFTLPLRYEEGQKSEENTGG